MTFRLWAPATQRQREHRTLPTMVLIFICGSCSRCNRRRISSRWGSRHLRGPAAILFTSRDTCSDSIAELFRASFYEVSHNYRAIRCKMGIAQMCLCETKYQEGVSHHFGGALSSLERYRAIWGIAAILSQYRALWGH